MLRKIKYITQTLLIITLSACGFRPLYVEREDDSLWHYDGKFNTSIIQEMAKIRVAPIDERFGQIVRNILLDSLTPKGQPENPVYVLEAELTNKEIVQQAMRDDITATRERVKYVVQYHLNKDNETIASGNSIAFVSYDILSNPYSTTFAKKETEESAAQIIANDIILRLGAYFNSELIKSGEYREL